MYGMCVCVCVHVCVCVCVCVCACLCVFRVKRWLSLVVEDASGLTFEEWDPTKDTDDSHPPTPMIINSSELRGAGFNLQEVIPPELESAVRLGRRTRGAGLRQLECVGRKRFVLSSDDDNELRSRCE
jgi:hypothetical protein